MRILDIYLVPNVGNENQNKLQTKVVEKNELFPVIVCVRTHCKDGTVGTCTEFGEGTLSGHAAWAEWQHT